MGAEVTSLVGHNLSFTEHPAAVRYMRIADLKHALVEQVRAPLQRTRRGRQQTTQNRNKEQRLRGCV